MEQLLQQLGIDWHLLVSQAVNFFLLLVVLWYFVYKPLLKLMRDRRDRIAEGLTKADEADQRLREVDAMSKGKVKDAEAQAIAVLRRTEGEARDLQEKMLAETKRREAEELANAKVMLAAQAEESREALDREAAALVRRAIARTVELAPEAIDDALIAKALKDAKSQ